MVEAFSRWAEVLKFRLTELCSGLRAAQQKIFGSRKRCRWLRKLFADVLKGMHGCGKFFRKAKSCSTFPGESRGTGIIDVLFGLGCLGKHVRDDYPRKTPQCRAI